MMMLILRPRRNQSKMGSQYLVTGVQLGKILKYSRLRKIDNLIELLDEIFNKQYIGGSNLEVEREVELMKIERRMYLGG